MKVCIAPEGTRSHTGKLQEFKKGKSYFMEILTPRTVPFIKEFRFSKIPLSSNIKDVLIVPVVLFNNFQLWPPGQLLPFSGEIR